MTTTLNKLFIAATLFCFAVIACDKARVTTENGGRGGLPVGEAHGEIATVEAELRHVVVGENLAVGGQHDAGA